MLHIGRQAVVIGEQVGNHHADTARGRQAAQALSLIHIFLYWVVTSDEGTTMMAEQFGPIPFKAAKASDNVFFNDANRYIAEGKYVVSWACLLYTSRCV